MTYRAVGLLLALAAAPLAATEPFGYQVIDAAGPLDPWGKSVGDVDGDGLPDLLVAGNGGDLIWYESPTFVRHAIANGGSFSTDLEVADLDGDLDADVVAVAVGQLLWYEAPGWIAHPIENRTLHDVEVADLDLDGDVDLVARDQGGSGDAIHLYRQDGPTTWVHRGVATPAGEGLALADVDRDGDLDVVVEGRWIDNPRSLAPGALWRSHVYSQTWTWSATFVAAGDIDGDGRVDVALAPSESAGGAYRISWFRAPADPTQLWTERVVDPAVETVHHSLALGDLDGDGDLDLASAEMHQGADPDEVEIYWNGGLGATWTRQVLATTGSHSLRLADFDGDGDLDLAGANWSGPHQPVELWRNGAAVFVDGFESGSAGRWSAVQP